MPTDRSIHFGWFIRGLRAQQGKKRREIAEAAGITERRLVDLEKQPEPVMNEPTFHRLAQALGMTGEQLAKGWRETEVEKPKQRNGGPKASDDIQIAPEILRRIKLAAAASGRTPEQLLTEFLLGFETERLESRIVTKRRKPRGSIGA